MPRVIFQLKNKLKLIIYLFILKKKKIDCHPPWGGGWLAGYPRPKSISGWHESHPQDLHLSHPRGGAGHFWGCCFFYLFIYLFLFF
jgi:hypothetical protein